MVQDKRIGLGLSSKRLLKAVSLLKENGYEGSGEGLSKILKGIEDGETEPLISAPYFGYWPSLSKKKIKGRLTQLVRHGFLSNVWVEEEQDYFLQLTEAGESAIIDVTITKKAPAKKSGLKTIIRFHKGEKK